jgi:predicted TIM-barrel fold metal-dependent hydrolase
MEFPSSDRLHSFIANEHDTSKLLAHAAAQARQRNYADMMIVDVDNHHEEGSVYREIIPFIEASVDRQLARNWSNEGRRPMVPRTISYEDGGGRMQRFALAATEKVPDNLPRGVALARRAMEAMGVKYACLLPTTTLRLGMQPKKEFEASLAPAYNRWLVESVLPSDSHVRGMLYLPLYDPDACHKTVVELGDRSVVVGGVVTAARYATIHDDEFLKTFAAMEERGLTLAFHSGANWTDRTMGLLNSYASVRALSAPFFNSIHMTNWLMNGMPERFPKLNVLWLESGIGWVPSLMMRLDSEYLTRSFDAPLLKRKPSEYMREMYYSSQPLDRPDDLGLLEAMFRVIGAETQLVWGSNYPNADFDLPSTIFDLPFLSAEAKQNILGRTAAKLFRLT